MPSFDFRYFRVLSIAGSDSGGGAGIQADLKTCAALGVYGMTAITAITAQNTQGVTAIHSIPTEVIAAQIDAVAGDIGVDAVKIGMLHAPAVAETVALALQRHGFDQVVLDPVMVATSGSVLMEESARAVLVQRLFPLATVITPNLDEASLLLGRTIASVSDMQQAARDLQAMGARAVLVKGGHLAGDQVVDVLRLEDGVEHLMADTRIDTRNTHGTGCTLSSAIAACLALGEELEDAVRMARVFVRKALEAGATVQTGQVGNGPLNHGFAPRVMRLDRL